MDQARKRPAPFKPPSFVGKCARLGPTPAPALQSSNNNNKSDTINTEDTAPHGKENTPQTVTDVSRHVLYRQTRKDIALQSDTQFCNVCQKCQLLIIILLLHWCLLQAPRRLLGKVPPPAAAKVARPSAPSPPETACSIHKGDRYHQALYIKRDTFANMCRSVSALFARSRYVSGPKDKRTGGSKQFYFLHQGGQASWPHMLYALPTKGRKVWHLHNSGELWQEMAAHADFDTVTAVPFMF